LYRPQPGQLRFALRSNRFATRARRFNSASLNIVPRHVAAPQ